jgi:hypothetical protein
MKPDWDKLAKHHANSKTVLIADVDCTAAGKPLCDKYGVKGYPTIKFFNPPDEDGEDYQGGRSFDELKKFSETELGPGCSVDTLDNCSAEQKKDLEAYMAMTEEERSSKLKELKDSVAKADKAHEELLKSLQNQYKESMDGVEALKKETMPKIKLLRAASPKAKADAAKDEV